MFGNVVLELLLQTFVAVGTSETKRQVFEFSPKVVQPQTVGKGRVEEIGFSPNLHLLFGEHCAECAHIVQAVGKFNEDSADVVAQRVEKLAKVVFLFAHIGCSSHHFTGFSDDFDQKSHIVAKYFSDVFNGVRRVFHDIVQKSRHHRVGVEHKLFSYNARHGHRVHNIGFSGGAFLTIVGFSSQCVGLSQTNDVVGLVSL